MTNDEVKPGLLNTGRHPGAAPWERRRLAGFIASGQIGGSVKSRPNAGESRESKAPAAWRRG